VAVPGRLTYLSPAPLYHSAPQAAVNLAIRHGGTVVIMEKFDPEQYLRLVERYRVTHSQLVPTMFSRMLKLPEQVRSRYDLSSLETAVHAAAPCPVPVKQQMIDWWGPVLLEYYASTEAVGFSACDSAEWLAHPGTVGKVVLGELHILDESFEPVPPGTPGTLWFKPGSPFRYFDDVEKTAESTSPDGSMVTVGDVGYLDERRLPVPHRPRHLHDHLGRRQHLPPGMREPPHHPPQGRRRRRLRRPQRRPRRGSQGRRPAHAGL
jgi:Acyl-CoA synthetases (AMP-forming)/AMP-acid ligases II